MESYWMKTGNKDLVTKRLDADLDNYFSKQATEVAPAKVAPEADAANWDSLFSSTAHMLSIFHL